MIAIFKTDVECLTAATQLIGGLHDKLPGFRITIDLYDEDKMLRIEGPDFKEEEIVRFIRDKGFNCVHLPVE